MSRWVGAAVAAVVLATAGCSDSAENADPPSGGASIIEVTSPVFGDGQPIPRKYSCDGAEVSPPLAWSGVPSGAAALALVVDDPDAPGGTYIHWVVANIGPEVDSLAEGQDPAGVVQVANSSGKTSYAGPCPPSGTHHYRFTLYALDKTLDVRPDDSLKSVFEAIDKASLGKGTLTGTYERQ
jgi:Raf kinase inhibitor-like YbhB/YbcL family protein